MKAVRYALLLATLIGASHLAVAQTDTGRRLPPGGRGRVGGRLGLPVRGGAANAQGQPMDPAERQAAIRLVRQAMNRAYRTRLKLDNEQMQTLTRTDMRYERQRQDLLRSERDTRQGLRAAMADSTPDQTRIAGFIDQLAQAQHKRADLLDAEQKELSTFLTPLQRAQYLGLKEQVDRRILQLRQQNARPPGAKNDTTPPGR